MVSSADHVGVNFGIAMACIERGWPVFACRTDSKKPHPLAARKIDAQGKAIPRTGGFYRATTDPAVLRSWFDKDPSTGIGIRCGQEARLIVLDVDVRDEFDGNESLRHLSDDLGVPIPETPTLRTPSGGRHLFMRLPDGVAVKNKSDAFGAAYPGLDVKTEGGYVSHGVVSKGEYAWIEGQSPDDLALAEFPSEFCAAMLKKRRVVSRDGVAGRETSTTDEMMNRARAYAEKIERSVEGNGGDQQLFVAACKLRRTFAFEDVAQFAAVLSHYNDTRCDPSWPEDRVGYKAEEAWREERYCGASDTVGLCPEFPDPSGDPLSEWDACLESGDKGRGTRLAWALRSRAMYAGDARGWFWWVGTHWERGEDARDRVVRFATRVMTGLSALRIQKLSLLGSSDDAIKNARSESKQHDNLNGTISRALEVARRHEAVRVNPETLDSSQYLLNVANGTVDLMTGRLRPHSRSDFLTSVTPLPFDPDADMSVVHQYLEDVTMGDAELQALLHRVVGWIATGEGSTRAKKFVFLVGGTDAGKGVFVKMLERALGAHAKAVSFAAIAGEASSGPNSELAQCESVRLIMVADLGGRPRWDGETLKRLTGGDTIACSEKHKPARSFRPRASLLIAANDMPSNYGAGKQAIFKRMILVPFLRSFDADPKQGSDVLKMDPHMSDRLHCAGLMRWIVEGARRYLSDGIGTCAAVEAALREYRDDQRNLTEEFCDEKLVVADGAVLKAEDLHSAFRNWYVEATGRQFDGTVTKTSRWLNAVIRNNVRFQRVKTSSSIGKPHRRGWVGIGLRPASGTPSLLMRR